MFESLSPIEIALIKKIGGTGGGGGGESGGGASGIVYKGIVADEIYFGTYTIVG